jgi:hypothetical protein
MKRFGRIFLGNEDLEAIRSYFAKVGIVYREYTDGGLLEISVLETELDKLPLDEETQERYFPTSEECGYSIWEIKDKNGNQSN